MTCAKMDKPMGLINPPGLRIQLCADVGEYPSCVAENCTISTCDEISNVSEPVADVIVGEDCPVLTRSLSIPPRQHTVPDVSSEETSSAAGMRAYVS